MTATTTRRAAYERAQRRRATIIATASTIIVVTALIVLVPRASGWQKVRQAFFDGDVFVDSFPRLVDAFWLDVKILLWSTPLILIVSLLVALARSVRSPALFPLKAFAVVYTDVMPRHPGDPADLPDRVRRARACGSSRGRGPIR